MASSAHQPPFATFREAFCHAHGCRSEDYLDRVLVQAIPVWRRVFLIPVLWVSPTLFEIDAHILEMLGRTRTRHEFSQLLDEFHDAIRVTRIWSKRNLGVRMSGALLMEIRDSVDSLMLSSSTE